MCGVFASGGCAIVTSGTSASDPGMVEPGSGPPKGIVAGVALVRALNMFGAFADCHNIIVAIQTRSGHRAMVHPKNGCPRVSRVAVGTNGVRPDMIRTFCS